LENKETMKGIIYKRQKIITIKEIKKRIEIRLGK